MTDLELVQQVLQGNAEAMKALDVRVVAQARRVAGNVQMAPDELAQLLRERLLVDKKLSTWNESGPLDAWLRTVAIRAASNARRSARTEALTSQAPDVPMIEPDPELRLLRLQYRDHFRAAFTEAMAGLEAEERTVLRLHTLDGLSLASIGTMFHKDASNVSRWLARIRTQVLHGTRENLSKRLSIEDSALESLMRVADSELTMSLSKLLS